MAKFPMSLVNPLSQWLLFCKLGSMWKSHHLYIMFRGIHGAPVKSWFLTPMKCRYIYNKPIYLSYTDRNIHIDTSLFGDIVDYIYIQIPTYLHTNIPAYIPNITNITYIHTYIHTYIQTYKHTNIQTNKQTNIHTYIHTYIHNMGC